MCAIKLKLKISYLLGLIFIILFSCTAFAEEKSKIILNGIETDIIAVGNVEDASAPLRPITERLGCEVVYDVKTGTFKAMSDGLSIEAKVGDKKALVNGLEIYMKSTPYIESDMFMAPISFIGDALAIGYNQYKLDFSPSTDDKVGTVEIYTSCPVWLDNKMGKIAARIEYFYEELSRWGNNPIYAEYDVCIPYFVDFKMQTAADMLNKNFENDFNAVKAYVKKDILVQKSEKLGDSYAKYTVTESRRFRIISQYKSVVSMVYMGYSYYGGAHGMPFINGVNINLENPYILPLRDLFVEGCDFENILIEKINSIIMADKDIYYVDKVEKLPASNSFYIGGENLIIYYDPYDIGPYAAGFVTFEIPLEELNDILQDNFKQ